MEKYKEMYNGICRVCLSYGKSDNFVSLTDMKHNDGLSCYGKAVRTFANICIKINDNLPTMMCQNCLILLKHAIRFKLKCELSQKRLELLADQIVNKNGTHKNIKSIIVQYVLFSHYFPNDCLKDSTGVNLGTKKLIEPHRNLIENQQTNQHSLKEVKCDSNDSCSPEDDNCETTLSDEDTSDDVFIKLDNIVGVPAENKNIESSCKSIKYVNDNIFKNNDEKREIKSSDHDSGDELLNQMDKNISKYSYLSVNDFEKQQIQRKNFKTRKTQARRLFIARSRLLARKLQYKSNKKNKETFVCTVCNRVLANQHTYEHHMQRHNGFRFICEHCGKGFPILAELQRHQVVRHGTGPFLQCQHCSYKAPRKLNLIEHERLHTGERPYTCDKCGLTFRRRAIWRKHMIYHAEKTVQCPHCPRKFFRVSEMQAHANSIHERLYVYLCHKCDATYAKTETVRRHLTERHGIPREMQGKIVRINKGRGTVFPDHEQ